MDNWGDCGLRGTEGSARRWRLLKTEKGDWTVAALSADSAVPELTERNSAPWLGNHSVALEVISHYYPPPRPLSLLLHAVRLEGDCELETRGIAQEAVRALRISMPFWLLSSRLQVGGVISTLGDNTYFMPNVNSSWPDSVALEQSGYQLDDQESWRPLYAGQFAAHSGVMNTS